MKPQTEFDESASILTSMDLDSQAAGARRSSALTGIDIDAVQRYLASLLLIVEGEIESPDKQNQAAAAILGIAEKALGMGEALKEISAEFAGVCAMASKLIEQRDAALRRSQQVEQRIIDAVVAQFGCTPDQAATLLTFMTSSEDDILAWDLTDLGGLFFAREKLQEALSVMGVSMEDLDD
jgi:hypothetical protein